MNLETYSRDELMAMLSAVGEELERRRVAEREILIEEICGLIKVRGFALDEMIPALNVATGRRTIPARKAAIKYRHPKQPTLVWSGRGKTPLWVKNWREKFGNTSALEYFTDQPEITLSSPTTL